MFFTATTTLYSFSLVRLCCHTFLFCLLPVFVLSVCLSVIWASVAWNKTWSIDWWIPTCHLYCWQLKWSEMQQSPVRPWQSSLCGAFAGGFSAAVTTPLDVAKTRIMLAPVCSRHCGDMLRFYNLTEKYSQFFEPDSFDSHGFTAVSNCIV